MSESNPDYRFSFYRPRVIWQDAWIEHATFGRVHYRLGAESGMGMLAWLMVRAGQPDGDVVITEKHGLLRHHLESLHRLATLRLFSPTPPHMVFGALRALADGAAWDTITCRNDLLAREYVEVTDGKARLQPSGLALIAPVTKGRAKKSR